MRLTGNITSTSSNSNKSNIISTTFDPSNNIDFTLYFATSGLITAKAIKVAIYTIQDGGNDLTDSDL